MIRNQILDDQLDKRGAAVAPFASVIGRLLEDAQERIIFLAQTYESTPFHVTHSLSYYSFQIYSR